MQAYVLLFLVQLGLTSAMEANPIRKIVTMMQNMQKEIEAEGLKEKELFDKFMCFCNSNNGDLEKGAADGAAKIEELTAQLKSEQAEKAQVTQELIDHKQDRENAQNDLNEATVIREKEASEFAAAKADMEANINAMAGAIPALEKGMGGAALLQIPEFQRLKKVVQTYAPADDEVQRRDVLAFFEQSGDYVPQSGQIVGILKNMKDSMEANLKDTVSDEDKAVSGFAELKASKEKEMELATEAIETKASRSGELAVSAVQTNDALEDAQGELSNTQKFLAQLKTQCATKEKEWATRQKLRAEEIQAISEAIGILNDDDALDVFKKAVPSSFVENQVGFLQAKSTLASKAKKAQAMLASAASTDKSPQLKLMLFTLNSKLKHGSQNFSGVIKMIDDMVTLLGKDQASDDTQKSWCQAEFEKSADEESAVKTTKGAQEAAISELTDAISAVTEEISVLDQSIKDLDKSVAQATEMRKDEHAEYQETQQLNDAATQLVNKAKNRLNKFYNPVLYKAAPKVEATMEEKIISAGTFSQISSHRDLFDIAQPQAPKTFGDYQKSDQKSAGVIGLMDMLLKEMAGDRKDAEYEEKTAQKEYTELMEDSQASRQQDAKSMTDKAASKASLEGKLQQKKADHSESADGLQLVQSYIADLHVSCDFLMQNYDLRKEARTNEGESLKNAKAILSGASFR